MNNQLIRRQDKGILDWFLHNHVAANILMMLFLVGGVLSISAIRYETFPATDPRLITIIVPYPGATASEVASSVTKRAEDALAGIEGVKRITSTATEGGATIKVHLADFADADFVYDEVETIINSLANFPPEDADKPVITKVRITPEVISLALYGDVEEEALRYWSEIIENELKELPFISLTSISGVKNREVAVELSENNLKKYNLILEDIHQAIENHSKNIAAGSIKTDNKEILLRVNDKKYSGSEVGEIIIKHLPNGAKLTIGDIAKVTDGFEDVNLVSKFNGKPAAFISVQRSISDDTLKTGAVVKDYLKNVSLPDGMQISIVLDETIILKDRISLMMRNGILGFMLVFLILILFLDLKLAFWTSMAIPISFLGGLMILYQFGYSINMITLFALIIVLGIVVDDGIIVGESIYSFQANNKSANPILDGVRAVIAPVTVGVMTTMAAFAPLLFSTGSFGQIVSVIPVVIIAILFISLIEAYFILPAHLSGASSWSRGITASIRDYVSGYLLRFVNNILIPFVRKTVEFRYLTLIVFVSLIIITGIIIKTGFIRFVFTPDIEGSQIKIKVTMEKNRPFTDTKIAMLKIEQAAIEVRDELNLEQDYSIYKNLILTIGTMSGSGSPFEQNKNNLGDHLGEVQIELVPSDFRSYSASQIANKIRQKVGELRYVEEINYRSSLMKTSPDIEVELVHSDSQLLDIIAEELKVEMSALTGTRDINDSLQEGKNEYIFKINELGQAVGLTPLYLGRQLRAAYFGLKSGHFQRDMSELNIYVRYNKEEREDPESLENIRIKLPSGKQVPLSSVVDIKKQKGFSKVKSVDGKKIISVTAYINLEETTPAIIINNLEEEIFPKLKAKYPGLGYSFQGESREQQEDMSSLLRNMMIALLLIYVVLGAQLRSYIQPFIIMFVIPFGVVGAVMGHLIFGYDLTFISFFGIVALAGVVVNDSVVLIDYLNKEHAKGTSIFDSAIEAVRERFRPILLTTLSTSLGLLPMLTETSLQAQFLIPMIVSLATGIIFASCIILFLVPCLIIICDDIKNLFSYIS